MKFILILLFFCFSILSFGQVSIPNHILKLGEESKKSYLTLTESLQNYHQNLVDNKLQFSTVEALVLNSSIHFNLKDESSNNGISYLMKLVSKGTIDENWLKINLTGSPEFKNLAILLYSNYIKLASDDEYNTVMDKLTDNVLNSNLPVLELNLLTQTIVALSSNYYVLTNSPIIRDTNDVGRRWWQYVLKAVQCGLGTAGGAVIGGLTGAAVGTVTLPIVGTVSGAAVGFYGGAAVGASASCF